MQLRSALRHLLDFCYPGTCAACEASCDGASPLCESCAKELRQLEESPACSQCAMPVARADAPCPYCLGKGVYPFEQILRLATYRDPIKRLILETKYHRQWPLAEFMADRLFAQSRVRDLLMQTQVIVPVPLHRLRQIARGYNQADVIARRLKSHDKRLKVTRPAVRLRNTETQTHQHSRESRVENLKDAFGLIDGRAIAGQHVVIIDDVMTTGATLGSLARTLLEAKPASLCALIVAIADSRGRDFEAI